MRRAFEWQANVIANDTMEDTLRVPKRERAGVGNLRLAFQSKG